MPAKLTTTDFIRRSRQAHGDRYDYSLAVYTGIDDKVKIICPIHGVFEQNPWLHSAGKPHPSGCPECGMKYRDRIITKTQGEFIQQAKEVHGQTYDYSLAIYENSRTEIIIICHIHGQFKQNPAKHIRGQGCPECGRWKAGHGYQSNAQFIQKAKEVHGDKYDYSLSDYVGRENQNEKIIIICPEHGQFLQRPQTHIEGHGCRKCGDQDKRQALTTSQSEFIEKAKEVHGDKYDYSLTNYIHSQKEITIICPIHGQFQQIAGTHIKIGRGGKGHGCPQCGQESKAAKTIKRKATGFIKKARQVHGDSYDYSLVVYKGRSEKVKIICPKHGAFEQIPSNHFFGQKCPKCGYEQRKEYRISDLSIHPSPNFDEQIETLSSITDNFDGRKGNKNKLGRGQPVSRSVRCANRRIRKGVRFLNGKWHAKIVVSGKAHNLGSFATEKEALEIRRQAVEYVEKYDTEPLHLVRPKRGQGKGYTFHKSSGKWEVQVRVNGKTTYLGLYPTEQEAQKVVLAAREKSQRII